MRACAAAVAVCLCAGLAVSSGSALAGGSWRLNGDFEVSDSLDTDNFAVIEVDGTVFDVDGFVTGIGTAADLVEITFFTPAPTNVSANDTKARVRQRSFVELSFFVVSDADERDVDENLVVEKCSVDGSVNMDAGTGKVTVSCSSPSFWAAFTQDQVTSIQAAFADNPRVKIKQSSSDPVKGGISITIKGDAFPP